MNVHLLLLRLATLYISATVWECLRKRHNWSVSVRFNSQLRVWVTGSGAMRGVQQIHCSGTRQLRRGLRPGLQTERGKFQNFHKRIYLLGAATSYIIFPPQKNISWLPPCLRQKDRPVTSLRHQEGEEVSERGTIFLTMSNSF